MILFKKWAKHKIKSYIYCENQFCARNAIKTETKNVNKNGLFYSIFVIFLSFWPLKLRK